MNDSLNQYMYRLLITVSLLILAGGTVFYHFQEHWSYIDSFYFCVVTSATVGYGDLVPKTDLGKLFTSFYILLSVGVIAAFASSFVKVRGSKMKAKAESKHKQ